MVYLWYAALHDLLLSSDNPMQVMVNSIPRLPYKFQRTLGVCATAVSQNKYNLANPYHSPLHHALVMLHAYRISKCLGIEISPTLMVAAAIHDYDYGSEDNSSSPCPELASFEKAREDGLLELLDFSEVNEVKDIVLATILGNRNDLRCDDAPILSKVISDADLTESVYAGIDNHITQTKLLAGEVGELPDKSIFYFINELAGRPIFNIEDELANSLDSFNTVKGYYR